MRKPVEEHPSPNVKFLLQPDCRELCGKNESRRIARRRLETVTDEYLQGGFNEAELATVNICSNGLSDYNPPSETPS
jgi:hypothetical protein